jgi:hypothetical protein
MALALPAELNNAFRWKGMHDIAVVDSGGGVRILPRTGSNIASPPTNHLLAITKRERKVTQSA